MNKNIIIVLAGSVFVAFLVIALVQALMPSSPKAIPIKEEAKVEVLVADKNLGLGRELVEGDLRWQKWPKNTVFEKAIVRKKSEKPEEALEGRLARNVYKDEPMIKTALLEHAGENFVVASLEEGMRAVAFNVSASSMVAGFINPGDYVDIILTYKDTIKTKEDDPNIQNMIEMNLEKLATETILQKVKVLAVDQTAKRNNDEEEGDKVWVGKTVTVAVDIQDAEKISLAKEIGELTLALRGMGDSKVVEKSWPTVSDARLTNIDDEIFSEYKKMKKDTGIQGNIVRTYSGADVIAASSK